jgi:hypothetical protein
VSSGAYWSAAAHDRARFTRENDMTSTFRIAATLAIALSSSIAYAETRDPNFDDATSASEVKSAPSTERQSLPYDVTTMKVKDTPAVDAPKEGGEARTRYDDTSMKFVETEASAHPMEQ